MHKITVFYFMHAIAGFVPKRICIGFMQDTGNYTERYPWTWAYRLADYWEQETEKLCNREQRDSELKRVHELRAVADGSTEFHRK